MRSFVRLTGLVACAILAAVRPVAAQEDGDADPFWERPVHAGLGVGVSLPAGQFHQGFDAGWDIGGGIATPLGSGGALWLQTDFNYEGQLARTGLLTAYGATGGGASVTSGAVNLVLNARRFIGRLTPYALVGGGVSWRYVELDNYSGNGYCNLFVGFCGTYGGPAVRSRTHVAPGWDAGIGVRFRIWPIRLFLEARANTIYTAHGSTTFVPLVLGTEW